MTTNKQAPPQRLVPGLRIVQRVETDEAEPRAKALTEEELNVLLDETPADWRLFFEFLAHTGLRIGEAVALTWTDVDFGKQRINVRRRLYRDVLTLRSLDTDGVQFRSRPGGQALWRRRGTSADDAPVFTTQAGARIDASNLAARVLKPSAKRAGVPWAGFHTFRHTCATMLFRHGLKRQASADVARASLARVHA